jgi:hypothetical protein
LKRAALPKIASLQRFSGQVLWKRRIKEMSERFKGQLTGNGFTADCILTPSPTGGWLIFDVTPTSLPEGAYALTFGDRHPKNPGIYKEGRARRDRDGKWTVEDVRDA